MKTLLCSPNSTLYLPKHSPSKPNFPSFHSRTRTNHSLRTSTTARASSKGFSSRPPASLQNDDVLSKKPRRNDEDDEIPTEVMYRIIGRILPSVGVPMGLGLGFLHLFGELKEKRVWDAPLWIPFVTTLLTFGASALGIAYGALSSSLDLEREGSFLGFEEVQRNWVEMWQEEDKS